MKNALRLTWLSTAAFLFTAAPAPADTLKLTLFNPTITLGPGNTYEFDGTVSAPLSNTMVQNLSDSLNPDSPLVGDDTDFLIDAPLALAPGQLYTGALFTITLPTGEPAGTYSGIFDVVGNDISVYSEARFTTNAPTPATVTPEPGTWLLLSSGLAAAGLFRRRLVRSA